MGFDVDKDLYFVRKETEGIKKSLTGFSHSMTGVKVDVEGLKFAVSLVAATAQFLKVDYSLWKIDEKGVTFRGVQKVTWKNVKDAEDEKSKEKEKKLDDRLKGMFLEKSKNEEIKNARETADKASREIRELRTTLRSAGEGAALKSGGRVQKELGKVRTSVQSLSQALAGI
ncbi:hypothetical protein [Streptomyces sp. NPDC050535]|uniref:hypothetical protein n=1 Tax=Streptomyces sp. NPDC050535 TaxID=3365626 RepID=UPI00378DB02F